LTAYFINTNTAVIVLRRQLQPMSAVIEVTTWRTKDGGRTWLAGEAILSNLGIVAGIELMMLNPSLGWMLDLVSQPRYSPDFNPSCVILYTNV
jgi:hypothetical protein